MLAEKSECKMKTVVGGLLIDGAQLKRLTLHNPCSPTNSTQIFFTVTASKLPIFRRNYAGLYKL
jgi:hypothetical protein